MRSFVILILSCASVLSSETGTVTNRLGETLIPLKAGEDARGVVSYGLFAAVSASRAASNAPAGANLILMLRNTGAKSINMEQVTIEDFDLQDSQGKHLKLYLWNSPRSMGYGSPTVVHLVVDRSADAVQPWTLRFRSKPEAHVPFDLVISGIEPRKR
jgi:hypothetical protein